MNQELPQLAKRIHDELTDLEKVLQRMTEGLARAKRLTDDYYLDGVLCVMYTRLSLTR